MAKETRQLDDRNALTGEEIRTSTLGDLEPLSDKIRIADYDPCWPKLFHREAARIGTALGPQALRIEHTGSTSVPNLAAKPIIDILLVVTDSAQEDRYAPVLEGIGYKLRIREPDWYEHRMFAGTEPKTNLHTFSSGCPEIERILLFRDWLRDNAADRNLYQRTKLALAENHWQYVQDYADAKAAVIQEILARAGTGRA